MMKVQCAGCERPIKERFLLRVLDRAWHAGCVTCSECRCSLTDRCFFREGRLYCRSDFFRRFGTKCAGCSQGICPSDLVRRAQSKVFHLNCFTCVICRRQLSTGEELYVLAENRFVCKRDYIDREFTGSDVEDETDIDSGIETQGNLSEKDFPLDEEPSRCPSTSTPVLAGLSDDLGIPGSDQNPGSHFPRIVSCHNGVDQRHMDATNVHNTNERHLMCNSTLDPSPRLAVFSGNSLNESIDCDSNLRHNYNNKNSSKSGSAGVLHALLSPTLGSSSLPRGAKNGADRCPLDTSPGSGDSNCSTLANDLNLDSVAPDCLSNDSCPSPGLGSDVVGGGAEVSLGEVGSGQGSVGAKRRGPRTTIKAKQLETLKAAFATTPKPTRHIREQLAQETGLNMRVIQVWFQNRRSKERRMKQLSALGARRHFFRNSRRMRLLRPGEDGIDGPGMLVPGIGYIDGTDELYHGYQNYGEYYVGTPSEGSLHFLNSSPGPPPMVLDGPIHAAGLNSHGVYPSREMMVPTQDCLSLGPHDVFGLSRSSSQHYTQPPSPLAPFHAAQYHHPHQSKIPDMTTEVW